ncbi:MAG: hypothetical protein QUS33_02375 [Dehalococcoidia bacterium]|nr:hypothetical protein [Dehalococcoidia bacterium]
MSEPPVKPKSVIQRLRSVPLRVWVIILVAESFVFILLVFLLVWIVFRGS